jgi:hypothetical protein
MGDLRYRLGHISGENSVERILLFHTHVIALLRIREHQWVLLGSQANGTRASFSARIPDLEIRLGPIRKALGSVPRDVAGLHRRCGPLPSASHDDRPFPDSILVRWTLPWLVVEVPSLVQLSDGALGYGHVESLDLDP